MFLDITASSDGRDTMVHVVEQVAEQVFIPFTVGGGVRSVEDARRMLRAGADKVSFNTAAVNDPDLVHAARAGVRRAVHRRRDRRPRREEAGWEVVTHGGRTPTGLDAIAWAERVVRARRGRDPADVDGPRRHQGRATTSRCCRRWAPRSTSRSSRAAASARSTTSTRARPRAARRGARRVDLPLRPAHRPRGKGVPGRTRGRSSGPDGPPKRSA